MLFEFTLLFSDNQGTNLLSPEIVAAVITLLGVVVTVYISFRASSKQLSMELQKIRQENKLAYTQQLLSKRMERYPDLYAIISHFQNSIRADGFNLKNITALYNQLQDWEVDNSVFISSKMQFDLFDLLKILRTVIHKKNKNIDRTYKQSIVHTLSTLELRMKSDIGVFIDEFPELEKRYYDSYMELAQVNERVSTSTNEVNPKEEKIDEKIDHLVYGTHHLEATVDQLADLLGVKANLGGVHPGWGTKNYLLSLGPDIYLEIIGPDPAQEMEPTLFGLDKMKKTSMLTWAMKCSEIPGKLKSLEANGYSFGEALEGSRTKSDGTQLSWTLSNPFNRLADGVLPFFIDWGNSPHPAKSSPQGCQLIDLKLGHPQALEFKTLAALMELELEIAQTEAVEITAIIQSPNGMIHLK